MIAKKGGEIYRADDKIGFQGLKRVYEPGGLENRDFSVVTG